MNYETLGTDLTNAILEVGKKEGLTAKMVWTAIAKEIVNHIKENTDVIIPQINTSVSVVLTKEKLNELTAGVGADGVPVSELVLTGTGVGVGVGVIDPPPQENGGN